ncbi:SRPBCC family protein [Leifsonia shinshuensis]|uniref:SRPBCC family protein n=1 Tax=Leifsonia shinshuensis TaxID=150026 RepID=A0A7G6Y7P4_9MICO|nr:SRPBCC family protein [Leifsonia shinshuensis]QNE34509.1 SRPBCC family protein [Leifsonia shinshuensis]
MPTIEASTTVPVEPDVAFAVSQTHGDLRLRWDRFIRAERLLDGATAQDRGVRTWTRHRRGMAMVSECVSFNPPSNTGMRMTEGPWFFERFAGGWQFRHAEGGGTRVMWRYSFSCRPRWLAPIAERIGTLVLRREIQARVTSFAAGCADEALLAKVQSDAHP